MLTKDALLERGKRRVEKVNVAGVGEVWMRSLSEAEWSQYQADSVDPETGRVTAAGLINAKRRIVALVLCDEVGNRLFKNSELAMIAELDASLVGSLADACEKFIEKGMPAKNSLPTTDDSLPSD